jgi:hypothetical protein
MKESLAMTVFDLIRISIQGGTRYYVLTDIVNTLINDPTSGVTLDQFLSGNGL